MSFVGLLLAYHNYESWCTPFETFFSQNICLKIACQFIQCLQLILELIVFFCVHVFEFIYLVSYGWYCPLLVSNCRAAVGNTGERG